MRKGRYAGIIDVLSTAQPQRRGIQGSPIVLFCTLENVRLIYSGEASATIGPLIKIVQECRSLPFHFRPRVTMCAIAEFFLRSIVACGTFSQRWSHVDR